MKKRSINVEPKPSLSPAKAAELREILGDRDTCAAMAEYFVRRYCQEAFKEERSRDFFLHLMSTQYADNIRIVFELSESPIETVFFNSLMISCIKNGVLMDVGTPPAGDFREAIADSIKDRTKLFECYSYYKALPDNAQPHSFLRFLEITGVETGGLSQENANFMNMESTMMFDLQFMHALHLTLQPTFYGLDEGRNMRADAVIWRPSDESVRIVVECDGFETHGEKDAFSRDRKRDRLFQSIGYSVRRYSGQEIHHQPIQASMDLLEYLIDQGKAYFEGGPAWEKKLRRSRSAKPNDDAIKSWRNRMAAEEGNQ